MSFFRSGSAENVEYHKKDEPSLGLAVFIFILQAFTLVVATVGVAKLSAPKGGISLEPSASIFLFIFLHAAFTAGVVIYFGIVRFGKVSLLQMGWIPHPLPRLLLIGTLGFIFMSAAVLLIVGLSNHLEWVELTKQQRLFTWNHRVLFLVIGLQAGFIEETVFRGFLQRTFVCKYGTGAGVVLTAMLFSIYHLNFQPLPLISKFILGIGYGVLKQRTGSLYPSAWAHVLTWFFLGTT